MNDLLEIAGLLEKESNASSQKKELISEIIAELRFIGQNVLDVYSNDTQYSDEELKEYGDKLKEISQAIRNNLEAKRKDKDKEGLDR